MTTARIPEVQEGSLTRDALYALRYYAGGRRGLFALAAIALAGGLWLRWPNLVAAGIAPILIALAPCAVMCALGLCMHKMTGHSPAGPPDASAIPSAEQQARLVAHGASNALSHEDQRADVAAAIDKDCCHSPQERRESNA